MGILNVTRTDKDGVELENKDIDTNLKPAEGKVKRAKGNSKKSRQQVSADTPESQKSK